MALENNQPVGAVTEATGDAVIIRADGSIEQAVPGVAIFQGDIIETEGDGAVNIGFTDDSSFAVSADARVTIDEFVFDPATESGAQDFSVARGVFMYTSGLIGRENPDSVEIDTPVGSIGIRGTIIGGRIDPEGESQVTVIEGAIVVRNDAGEQLLTTQFDTVKLTNLSVPPSAVETLNVESVANDYGAVRTVSSGLFSGFDDQMREQGPSNNLDGASDAQPEGERASETDEQAQGGEDAAAQAVQQAVAEANATQTQGAKTDVTLNSVEAGRNAAGNSGGTNANGPSAQGGEGRGGTGRSAAETRSANAGNDNDTPVDPRLLTGQAREFTLQFQSGGTVNENSLSGTVVGVVQPSVTLPFAVSYSLIDPANLFSIDRVSGEIKLAGQAGDFESVNQAFYDLRVIATRTDTGTARGFDMRVNLADVNEAPDVSIALGDAYDISGAQSAGVIALDTPGAILGRLTITDPENGSFTAGDFAITGTIAGQPRNSFFEIAGNNTEGFMLKLKDGVSVSESGGVYTISNGLNSYTLGTSDTFNLPIRLNDGSLVTNESLTFGFESVRNVSASTPYTLSNTDLFVNGSDGDDVFIVRDNGFKLIRGGEGYDIIRFDSDLTANPSAELDLTPVVSNLTSLSADLKGIEEIVLSSNSNDIGHLLKMNAADVLDLLRTSSNGELRITANDFANSAERSNVAFYDANGRSTLPGLDLDGDLEADFTANGMVTRDGQTYHVFEHDLGTVLLDTDLASGASGGLV